MVQQKQTRKLYPTSIERTKAQIRALDKKAMVMFYAHWCPHCNNTKTIDQWKRLAKMKPHGVPFYAINCADEPQFCHEMKVGAFPTIRYFDGKTWHDYTEPREENMIKQYILRQHQKQQRPMHGGGNRLRRRIRTPRVCGRKTRAGGRCQRRGVCPYHSKK